MPIATSYSTSFVIQVSPKTPKESITATTIKKEQEVECTSARLCLQASWTGTLVSRPLLLDHIHKLASRGVVDDKTGLSTGC